MTGSAKVAKALPEKYGHTFSDELGIKLESNTPSRFFAALRRVTLQRPYQQQNCRGAARALTKDGWTSSQKISAATWRERCGFAKDHATIKAV